MNIEHVEKSYQELESDSTLQNLIAQANARYILYNTEESKENFPRYTIKDEQLNILAFIGKILDVIILVNIII